MVTVGIALLINAVIVPWLIAVAGNWRSRMIAALGIAVSMAILGVYVLLHVQPPC